MIQQIIQDVSDETGIDLYEKTRQRENVYARSVAFKLARDLTLLPLQKIGKALNKNHATVLHALKNFEIIAMYEPKFYSVYLNIRNKYERGGNILVNDVDLLNDIVKFKK